MILHAEEDFRILTYITTDVDGIKTWVLIDTVLPGVLLKPSIDVVGSSNPNQMRWPRETICMFVAECVDGCMSKVTNQYHDKTSMKWRYNKY